MLNLLLAKICGHSDFDFGIIELHDIYNAFETSLSLSFLPQLSLYYMLDIKFN